MNKMRRMSVPVAFIAIMLMARVFMLVVLIGLLFVFVVMMRNDRMRKHQHICREQTQKDEVFVSHWIQM